MKKLIFGRPKLSINLVGYFVTTFLLMYFGSQEFGNTEQEEQISIYLVILMFVALYFTITLSIAILLHTHDLFQKIITKIYNKIIEKRSKFTGEDIKNEH